MVPPLSRRIPRVRRYSGFCRLPLSFAYLTLTFSGWLSHTIRLLSNLAFAVLTPDVLLLPVWPSPLSLATTRGISVDFFSSPYLDVSVREVPHVLLCVHNTFRDSSSRGFPHSDICGSRLICSSPQLFAACHVLLRLLMPRHSPYALLSLNSSVYILFGIYLLFSLLLELLCFTFAVA